ncbi:MFS transporter [Desulfosarcina sp. OttesenSCG-928-A07]|nr:MFS transporter [Desulfosarcina sp. OttesenSCG-928-G17]MDL2329237.1 MFS transporter [Desulfosarcina sp. OttesenSCG-928-A07]
MKTHPEQLQTQTNAPKSPLVGMGTTYAMGTFNDNFFKQATMLLAAGLGMQLLQGVATVLFALPFVLFSAWAGWIADRYPKRKVIISSKYLELFAMIIGGLILCGVHGLPSSVYWGGILFVIFTMSFQSTFFSPALNGAIPEHFSAAQVPKVNAILKLATTVTILMGIALGGIMLDLPALAVFENLAPAALAQDSHVSGRIGITLIAVFVSLVGIVTAHIIKKTPLPPFSRAPFPLWGPVDSLRQLGALVKTDPALFLAIIGEAFFYGISLYVINCLNNLGKQLAFSNTQISLLSVALMMGVCIGAFIAGRHEAAIWRKSLVPSGLSITAGLFLAGLSPCLPSAIQFGGLFFILTLTGIGGGFYLIPLVSFVQIRPAAFEKGKILGVSNFSSFLAILLSGLMFSLMSAASPDMLLLLGGIFALGFMIWAGHRSRGLPDNRLSDVCISPLGFFARFFLKLRYKFTVRGLDQIPAPTPDAPILFLPNHPALIDPFIVYAHLSGVHPRPLADARQFDNLPGRLVVKLLKMVVIPDSQKDGAQAHPGIIRGMEAITRALSTEGNNVLFYPSGRIYRSDREAMGANSGAAGLIKAIPGLRVVLIRTTGLWGSRFSYGFTGNRPSFFRELGKGILILLANFLFFTPRRKIKLEFVESPDLPRTGDKTQLNPWLDVFYNAAQRPAFTVPCFFWQGSGEKVLMGTNTREEKKEKAVISAEMEYAVYRAIRETAGLCPDESLTREKTLGADLGMDSFMLMALSARLGDSGKPLVKKGRELVTVGDCLDAVAENELTKNKGL